MRDDRFNDLGYVYSGVLLDSYGFDKILDMLRAVVSAANLRRSRFATDYTKFVHTLL